MQAAADEPVPAQGPGMAYTRITAADGTRGGPNWQVNRSGAQVKADLLVVSTADEAGRVEHRGCAGLWGRFVGFPARIHR